MAVDIGKSVLRQEAQSLLDMADGLGEPFERATQWVLQCKGRIITCGVGKSGHIARKTAGTLSSTGTLSLFLHAAEAVHGDLGMVHATDIVMLYSQSGETDEVVRLFPAIRSIGAKTILVTGRGDSSAGRLADLILDTGVEEEACPHNLAPTTSTTAMLALSDALAVAVMDARGFTREDFAKFHPSGTLGKRLLLRVSDVMRPLEDISVVTLNAPVLEVIREMTQAGVGATCVLDSDQKLLGLIAESDLRRHSLKGGNWSDDLASSIMNATPYTIESGLLAIEALEVFQNLPKQIGEMPVIDGDCVVGLLVLKDLLRSGIL